MLLGESAAHFQRWLSACNIDSPTDVYPCIDEAVYFWSTKLLHVWGFVFCHNPVLFHFCIFNLLSIQYLNASQYFGEGINPVGSYDPVYALVLEGADQVISKKNSEISNPSSIPSHNVKLQNELAFWCVCICFKQCLTSTDIKHYLYLWKTSLLLKALKPPYSISYSVACSLRTSKKTPPPFPHSPVVSIWSQ